MLAIRNSTTSPSALALWHRRADALREITNLLAAKPDHVSWTEREIRIWRYATAISRRLHKLH